MSGHAARLNLADCFAYALALDLGEPLLFKRLSEVVASYGVATP